MTKPSVTKTSTKNEIFEAYETLLKKVSEMENLKPQEIKEKAEKQAVVKKVAEISPGNIVTGIADLKLKVAESLDQIEDTLLSEQKKLSDIQRTIEIQLEFIEELYQIKVNANSLAAILLAHKEKKEQIVAEEEKLKLDQERQREEFAAEMDEKRKEWEKERIRIQADLKEEKDRLKKECQREEEEYEYDLQLERRKEQDTYQEKQHLTEKEFLRKMAEKQKELQVREELIASKESEFNHLRQKVDSFPGEIEKSVTETEKRISDQLTTKYQYERELSLKDHEGLVKLKDQIIQTLESRIKELENQMKTLNLKTDLADKSVKDIAIKAIESSGKVQLVETPLKKDRE
jgi:hypothetical protein